ncbi:hypothetical protein [Pseudonocardia sp. McavD-2-B]|uniref:hypothetical protein n=1 Tax=Pseudonocardia sp. McavD-2-B TaxID=2954499 RepID=UPI0020970395|nr:hypothetical protein [Pseudonocardia sp. McavD-2-B]MCO7196629.1 hypothetical protein [Pseudonocardia sp. McavD-2-B]
MKRIVQTVLVLAAIGCALVLSGTATVALAAAVNVPGWAHPAAVGIVEVVAVTGTWLWVTEPRLRWEAATAVVLASAVSGYAGVHAYGAFGLVGPVGAIVTTHLVARAWTVPATTGQGLVVDEGADTVRTPHPDGVRTVPELDQAEPGADDDRRQPPVVDRAEALIADGAGRRRLAKELEITEHQARELLAGRRNGQVVGS